MRLKIIRLIIIISFAIISLGLISLQVVRGKYYQDLSINNRIRVVPIEGARGRILDRNGIVLAGTRVSFDVMVVPQELKDKDKLFLFLAQTLKTDKKKLMKIFQKRTVASFVPVIVAQDVSRDEAIILEEGKFRFPGLMINVGSKRYYPFKKAGAHVLGYVGKVNRSKMLQFKEYGYSVPAVTGYSGIEEFYDSFLKGEDGGLQVEVNHRGEQMRMLGLRSAIRGQDITLTIDSRIQEIAAKTLGDKTGVIIVLKLDTGEVLGMVSSPSFDPNVFVKTSSTKEKAAFITGSKAPMLNRAIGGQYPPGSTFKVLMALAALDTKKISVNSTFSCHGFLSLGRHQFRCSHSHGVQNFTEAIAHSCNVYFYNVGMILGGRTIRDYAHLFGLGSPTNIDLPYEEKGLIPDPDHFQKLAGRRWSKGDVFNFSIGQGHVLATPLQIANLMATVARGGKEISPFVMKFIGSETASQPRVARTIDIPLKDFDTVKVGLKAAVGDYAGTARVLYMKDLLVLGKTGTAQTSGNKPTHAWFTGFCPETKTKIVFCIFLEHGGSSYNACRLAKKFLRSMQKEKIL